VSLLACCSPLTPRFADVAECVQFLMRQVDSVNAQHVLSAACQHQHATLQCTASEYIVSQLSSATCPPALITSVLRLDADAVECLLQSPQAALAVRSSTCHRCNLVDCTAAFTVYFAAHVCHRHPELYTCVCCDLTVYVISDCAGRALHFLVCWSTGSLVTLRAGEQTCQN
jgi:hypothetical protein